MGEVDVVEVGDEGVRALANFVIYLCAANLFFIFKSISVHSIKQSVVLLSTEKLCIKSTPTCLQTETLFICL